MQYSYDGLTIDPHLKYTTHYYHIFSKKTLPRKPDGIPLCTYCTRNLGVQYCKDCQVDYCLSCHR